MEVLGLQAGADIDGEAAGDLMGFRLVRQPSLRMGHVWLCGA
jgi:hypothetical protein